MMVRDTLLSIANDLDQNATWDDVYYKIKLHQDIMEGLRDAEEGRFVSAEDVEQFFFQK